MEFAGFCLLFEGAFLENNLHRASVHRFHAVLCGRINRNVEFCDDDDDDDDDDEDDDDDDDDVVVVFFF